MASSPSPTPQSSTLSPGPDPSVPKRSLHRVLSAGRLGNRADGEAVIERDDAKGYSFSRRENFGGIEAVSGAPPLINNDNTPTIRTSSYDSRLHSFFLGSDRATDRERPSSTTPRTIYSACIFSSANQYRNSGLTVDSDAPLTMGPPPPAPPRRIRLPSRPTFHSNEPGSSRCNEEKKVAFDDDDDEAAISYPRSSFVGGGMLGSSPHPRAYRRIGEIQSAPPQPDPSIANPMASSQGQEDITISNDSTRHRTSPTMTHPGAFGHSIPEPSSGPQRSSKKRPRSSPSGQDSKKSSERVPPLRGWDDEAKSTNKRSSRIPRPSDRSMPPPPLPMRFTAPSVLPSAPPTADRPRTPAKPPRSSSLSNGTRAGTGKKQNRASSARAKKDSCSNKKSPNDDRSSVDTGLPLCKVHGTSFRMNENNPAFMKGIEALRREEEEFFQWRRELEETIRCSITQDTPPMTSTSSERATYTSKDYNIATSSATGVSVDGTSTFSAGSMTSNSNSVGESSMEYLNPAYIDDRADGTYSFSASAGSLGAVFSN